MERKTTNLILLLTLGFSIGLSSCYYDKEEMLYPSVPCDTTSTFASRIAPLVQQQCASGCHEGADPSGGVPLTTYDEIKACINNNNSFASSLDGSNGYSLMPKGTAGLNTCDMNAINTWIAAGAPNN